MQAIFLAGGDVRSTAHPLHAATPLFASSPMIACALATAIAAETEDQRVAIGIAGQPTGRFR